jgi:Bax protein
MNDHEPTTEQTSDTGSVGPTDARIRQEAAVEMRRIAAGFAVGLAVLVLLVLLRGTSPELPYDEVLPTPPEAPEIQELPDFSSYEDVKERKQRFFDYLLPVIEHRNAWAREARQMLRLVRMRMDEGIPLTDEEREIVVDLGERYRVKVGDTVELDEIDLLLRRADEIPPSLVLAQAAAESAWGTSRFARMANNLFGQWCFTEGCGLVPQRRPEGASHEVKRFDSVPSAVDGYYRNLNSHPAYEEVRERRARARAAGRTPEGVDLAAGLERYSERGQDYIDEIRSIIRFNDLDELDTGTEVARVKDED